MQGLQNVPNASDTIAYQVKEFESKFKVQEIVKRAMKYIFEGLAVALAAFYFPSMGQGLKGEEIAAIALTAAATFALLDLWAPSMYVVAQQGAGFGIGAGLVGGIPTR
jgi:hypothetical protein